MDRDMAVAQLLRLLVHRAARWHDGAAVEHNVNVQRALAYVLKVARRDDSVADAVPQEQR